MPDELIATLCESEAHGILKTYTIDFPLSATGGGDGSGMGDYGVDGSAKVVFQDLTRVAGHDPRRTRLFHIMFHGEPEPVQRVAAYVSRNFVRFYNQVREAYSSDHDPNPLGLPRLSDSLLTALENPDQMTTMSLTTSCLSPNCPCNLLGVTTQDGVAYSAGMVSLCHPSPCPMSVMGTM